MGTFFILALTRYIFPVSFKEFIQLPITEKYFRLQGKKARVAHPFSILLFIVQILSCSVFIFLFLKQYNLSLLEDNHWVFMQIVTSFCVFVVGKYYLAKIIGQIFKMEAILNQHLFEKMSYFNLISILILALNVVFVYVYKPTVEVVFISLAVVVLFGMASFISSIRRNINIIFTRYLYFILYLCALEIAPYIILYKVVA